MVSRATVRVRQRRESEQQASIFSPITITSSGVLNEVAHGSGARANHCSLLPKIQR